ncbi:MAG: hypothetical protein V3U54_12780 [Thermodesulfobacteriota bacterium]
MSHDITGAPNDPKADIYIGTYMGAFRMLSEQGFDWYASINASDANCGVSGCGETLDIKLIDLEDSIKQLQEFNPDGTLSSEGRDEYTYRKPILLEFMGKCVVWCEKNNQDKIPIYFG